MGRALFICLVGSVNLVLKFQGTCFSRRRLFAGRETNGKRVKDNFSKDRPRFGPCPAALLAPVVAPWP